jgi:hypothetical protein
MAIKEGFRANSSLKNAVTADGYPIIMYNKHTIYIEITNSLNKYRISDIKFIAINIERYNAILG